MDKACWAGLQIVSSTESEHTDEVERRVMVYDEKGWSVNVPQYELVTKGATGFTKYLRIFFI